MAERIAPRAPAAENSGPLHPSETTAGVSAALPFCHPEEPTCLWQVKGGMNAEIDIDSIGFVFCSLGACDFFDFRVFFTPNRLLF
jgi:hypothetical protein